MLIVFTSGRYSYFHGCLIPCIMKNKQTLGVSPAFVQSHVTHPSLVKRWALNNFMGRSAEDSASSKHPTSTHGPNYRFPPHKVNTFLSVLLKYR